MKSSTMKDLLVAFVDLYVTDVEKDPDLVAKALFSQVKYLPGIERYEGMGMVRDLLAHQIEGRAHWTWEAEEMKLRRLALLGEFSKLVEEANNQRWKMEGDARKWKEYKERTEAEAKAREEAKEDLPF